MKIIKDNLITITFILTSLINSFILVNMTSGIGNIRFLAFDLVFLLFICCFSKYFKNKKRYYLIISIILTFICVINSFFYNEYNDFLSVYLLETFFQALKLPSEAITNVFEIKDFIFIIQILIMILISIFVKDNSKNISFKYPSFLLVILLLTFNANDFYRFKNTWNNVYQINNFGVYSYQLKDIMEVALLQFDDLGKTKAINEVEEYYSLKEDKKDNKYTNIFKDKNVLLIHLESIQTMFVEASINGQAIMPNLSKLASNGLYFTNYYSTESVGTSSDAEFTFNNSILPVGMGTIFLNYENNNYQSSIELLNKMGYYTFSMHGNKCDYWNRNNMYKEFGYQHFYCYDDYDLTDKIGLGLSDKSFFNQSADVIKQISDEHDKFYGTLITLTNHTPFYNNGKVTFDVGDLEGTIIGDYIKLVHYADEAIGEFINKLDKLNLLEDTVIIFYGDHDAKFKTSDYEAYLKSVYNNSNNLDFYEYEDLTKVPLLIWTKEGSVKGRIDKLMSVMDVMPTLGNMLGFESDYALGNDIFNIEDNIVVFPNGNFRTDKVYYNAQTDNYKAYSEIDLNYIKEKEEYAKKIVEISNYLVKYNLIKD